MSKKLILIPMLLIVLSFSQPVRPEEVPTEAREAAGAYLMLRALDVALGDPYPRYVMNSQDLLKITKDESSLLANADFVCFDFPYFIDKKPKGMVSVRKVDDKWEYYSSSGQEQLYTVIHDIRTKRPTSEISLLSVDSHRFFAVVAMPDKTFLIPKNSHTHALFNGTIYEDEEFPWISYSIARSVLQKYASGDTDKGCIKHEE